MNHQLITPDGLLVGTGLQLPTTPQVFFPVYEDSGPMYTMDELRTAAATKQFRGRDKFDSTWVRNQRSHGSCNGFAGASALSRAMYRRTGVRVDLSGAYLYSLINGGRDQGSMLEDGMKMIQSRGIATEQTVGWDAIYRNRYDSAKADAEAAQNKAFECYAVRSEDAMFSALASNFDVVVAVHADNGFMRLDSDGVAGGGSGPGNHAVLADGFSVKDTGELVADGTNSWDVSYGDQGRMGLTWRRHFCTTTTYHVFYAIRSTLDGSHVKPPVANN